MIKSKAKMGSMPKMTHNSQHELIFRTIYYSYHGSILASFSITLSTKSVMGY